MKKMGFTKSGWLSFLGRSLSLALFFCFAGLQSSQAQVVAAFEAGETTTTAERIDACNGEVTSSSTRFTDDGTNDGNYSDPVGQLRADTVEFCPKDQWHRVKVVFTDFDLAVDDTLLVFEGDIAAVRTDAAAIGCGSGTGVGVANAFGGWKDASCSPMINPTGCLTFVLKTNGDNIKGAGWDAWVDCEQRDVELTDVVINDVRLQCGQAVSAPMIIPAPFAVFCGDSATLAAEALIDVTLFNQQSEVLSTFVYNSGGVASNLIQKQFAVGQYRVEFALQADPTKRTTSFFSVQAPSLVANDEINVALGAACAVTLTPDDILEQTCDTIPGSMYYNITVSLGSGKDAQTLVTTGFDNLGAVTYPVITREALAAAGVSACGGTGSVTIERIFYGDRDGDGLPDFPRGLTICDNGVQAVSATTQLVFNDVAAPWVDVTAAPSTIVACGPEGLERFFGANGIDNCDDNVDVDIAITLDETDPCFATNGTPNQTTATVVFTAVDACGNVGTATRTVTILRPDVQNPVFLVQTENVEVECDASASPNPFPGIRTGVFDMATGDFTSASTTDTVSLSDEDYVCGYILVESVEDIPATDCGQKQFVFWDVLDWCTPANGPIRIDTTFVEYVDRTAPAFAADAGATLNIELDHFSCTFDVSNVSAPNATDNCDANPTVTLNGVSRVENGTRWLLDEDQIAELDCDTFELEWIVEDDCHEQLVNDTVTQLLVIQDVTKPSAACVDQLNVSIPNEEGALVSVDDIDAGSFDACGIASKLIRIVGSGDDFAETVTIGCEFVHTDLQIEMLVTDNKGNTNTCWLDIAVEDKINPFCSPLADVTEDCEEFHSDELGASTDTNEDLEMDDSEFVALTGDLEAVYNAAFGNPTQGAICEDNLAGSSCGELEFEQQYQLIQWPCGEAKATRRYRAIDWSGNVSPWVSQNINIVTTQNWKITFPADWEGSCGDLAPAEDIVIENGACDLLGFEVTERRFDIPGDACFKIERTYHVINWCTFVAGEDPVQLARVEGDHGISEGLMVTSEGNEAAGSWTYIQVLRVHDDEAPVVTVIDPDPCINGVDFDALPYGEEDVTPGFAPFECDEIKTWEAIATDCSSNISWEARLYNAATGELVASANDYKISHVVSNKETFFAEFWAFDNCGNSAGNRGEDVQFWDCKRPTPYVLNGVAVEIGQNGEIQVWATDLDQASFDNCTDQSKLDFRIWSDLLGDAPTDLAGVQALGQVITFDCSRVGNNLVQIYVIDEEGNFDFAQTFVIVQDNLGSCGASVGGMVAGRIVNSQGENVENVAVTVEGTAQASTTTGADGQFQFQMEMGGDYTVTPVKDINPLNGVSTFDLVLISKHILGITQFDSPYKYIAADVNKSGSITAFDMVQLRQLILNIRSEFPSNDSWRFVDASHDFASANPASEDFSEFYTINTLSGDMINLDFVGVKVGDVNGNAQANSLLGAESRSTNGALTLTAADRFVEVGEAVTVAFTAADIASAQGYQFTMNFAGQNADVVEGVAKTANFNTTMADRGVIATSWNGEATANDVLFSLTFNATASGLLSELVSVSSDVTTAEAYNTNGELLDVNLEFTTPVAAGFELTQNTPNPFKGETVIGFNLPTAGNATLTVMDAQGKVLKSISADYAKGNNVITLRANELGATGVLYYQLESADNVATKKMIIIE